MLGEANVVYRTIERFPGYRFGDDGSVWTAWAPSGRAGHRITGNWKRKIPTKDRLGYLRMGFGRENGKRREMLVHAVIAEAFLGPRPEGLDCCHNDGNPSNCAVSNLRYDTRAGNMADKWLHGTQAFGESHWNSKLTYSDVLRLWDLKGSTSIRKLAKQFGICHTTLRAIFQGRTWRHIHEHLRDVRDPPRGDAENLLAGADHHPVHGGAGRLDAPGRALEAAQCGAGDGLVCVLEGVR